MNVLNVPSLIKKKRDGLPLSQAEIEFFVQCLINRSIQESQIGAMLMAIFLKGMTIEETTVLTQAMTRSGDVTEFRSEWDNILVDKHSTGGVGDKISLILAPALAASGLKVPMVSGRGLAFTGGTLDKLESIPGFRINLSKEDMIRALEDAGCFIAGATAKVAPADGILYQHRDITNTVDCLPLIVSSILSKKAAEGTKALVMDIKVGKGTFMKTVEEARELVDMMIKVGNGLGLKIKAVLTRMDVPIGQCVGNALEVEEAVECLRGNIKQDVCDLVETLGGVLLEISGKCANLESGKQQIREVLQNGKALEMFQKMLEKQGVSKTTSQDLCQGKYQILPQASKKIIRSSKFGYVADIDALKVANICWELGAGRAMATNPIDHSVGVRILATPGDKIAEGDPIFEVYYKEKYASDETFESCLTISDKPPTLKTRIIDVV